MNKTQQLLKSKQFPTDQPEQEIRKKEEALGKIYVRLLR